jgi:hypothetical protein
MGRCVVASEHRKAIRRNIGGSEHIVSGVFTPVLAKHSKSFSLIDCISVGVDRMQRDFEPTRKQVEAWQRSELTEVTAKVVIYESFVEGKLEAPKHLARTAASDREVVKRGTRTIIHGDDDIRRRTKVRRTQDAASIRGASKIP